MNFLEKDLEQIIYETPNEKLKERGLSIGGKKKRQIRIGNYGICDLITIENDLFPVLTIWELKKGEVNNETFFQAVGYARAVQHYLENKNHRRPFMIEIALVGSCINDRCSVGYIPEIFPNVRLFTYSYSFDGIQFKKQGSYSLIDPGF